jgi:hypothetical protein
MRRYEEPLECALAALKACARQPGISGSGSSSTGPQDLQAAAVLLHDAAVEEAVCAIERLFTSDRWVGEHSCSNLDVHVLYSVSSINAFCLQACKADLFLVQHLT